MNPYSEKLKLLIVSVSSTVELLHVIYLCIKSYCLYFVSRGIFNGKTQFFKFNPALQVICGDLFLLSRRLNRRGGSSVTPMCKKTMHWTHFSWEVSSHNLLHIGDIGCGPPLPHLFSTHFNLNTCSSFVYPFSFHTVFSFSFRTYVTGSVISY
jgi:hypothetical protein